MTDFIASRQLKYRLNDNADALFILSISRPKRIGDEYSCEIFSEDVLFKGVKKSYGIDEIDCIDCAIQMIDLFISELPANSIFWPDGSRYLRTLTHDKMNWSPSF